MTMPIMIPGISASGTPRLHELGWESFEKLCRDLFANEPDVATCDKYGVHGQSQYGIDLIARPKRGKGLEVGQCKCYKSYEKFKVTNVREVSKKFFDNWKYWSNRGVSRFILFVACDLEKTKHQNEITKQGERFRDEGIAYEVWSATTILDKLQHHRGIVERYFSPPWYWAGVICGEGKVIEGYSEAQDTTLQKVVQNALISQLEILYEKLSVGVEEDLERIREAWRRGNRQEAIDWLQETRGDQEKWSVLMPDVKAKIYRLEAGLELEHSGNLERARQLIETAAKYSPSEADIRLRSMATLVEDGPEAAIEVFGNNHQSIENINFRATLLLEVGQLEECQKLLWIESLAATPNAETHLLRAIWHLINTDLNHAQLEIKKASEIAPAWESVRYIAAIVDYLGTLSPAVFPEQTLPWPKPIEWNHVKRDSESLQRLRSATNEFRDLANIASGDNSKKQSRNAWLLACLANDPDARGEALSLCKKMLDENPVDFNAVIWGVARNLDIELEPTIQTLELIWASGNGTREHVMALISCYLAVDSSDKAVSLIKAARPVFDKVNAKILWVLWYAQVLVMNKRSIEALELIERFPDDVPLLGVKTHALSKLAAESDDWVAPLVEHLDNSFEATGNPMFLYEACVEMAHRDQWDYVANKAEQLSELGIVDAVWIAVHALHNTGQFERCLENLDSRRHIFQEGALPGALQRIRISCLHALGLLSEAIREAEALVRESPVEANLLTLAELLISMGDLKHLVLVGRKLAILPEVSPKNALRIVQFIASEDINLAQLLWEKALTADIHDELVGFAFTIGMRLGLDEKLKPLRERLVRLGREGRGGVQTNPIEEFISEKWAEQQDLWEVYRAGNLPIHLVADRLNRSLIDFYSILLENNEANPDPIHQAALFCRHGGRPTLSNPGKTKPDWRLHMDITAVLLAEHLEILTTVENVLAPLFIPERLVPALLHMHENLQPIQPSRLHNLRELVENADRGILKVINSESFSAEHVAPQDKLEEKRNAFFQHARKSEGFLVDFAATATRPESASLVVNDTPPLPVIAPKTLIDSLLFQGYITEDEHLSAVEKLGSEGQLPSGDDLPPQATHLFCIAGTLETLVGTRLLGLLCEHFEIFIDPQELIYARSELEFQERRATASEGLDRLINRISRGFENRIYQQIVTVPEESQDIKRGGPPPPYEACLLALLRFSPQESDVIWIDDRYMNGYLRRDVVPIVSISKILRILNSIGAIDQVHYYRILRRFRDANARYIPVEAEEILYHLTKAKIVEHGIVETRGLASLRRYFAACLHDGRALQRSPMPEGSSNEYGEIEFVVRLRRAVDNALLTLWTIDENEGERWARAEWLLDALYLDVLGLSAVTLTMTEEKEPAYLVGLSLASLILQAITLPVSQDERSMSLRQNYLDWVENRLLHKRINAAPGLLTVLCDIMKPPIVGFMDEKHGDPPTSVILSLVQAFYDDLPQVVKDEFANDSEFMLRLGIMSHTWISIGDLNFDRDSFIYAVEDVSNGKNAQLITLYFPLSEMK